MNKDEKKQEEPWSWETDILAQYPSGVDWSQIEERLKLTPTERLERMRQFLEFLEGAKRRRGVMSLSDLQKAKRSAGRLKDLPDLAEIERLLRGSKPE